MSKKLRTPFIAPRKQGGTFYTFASAMEDIGLNVNESNNIIELSHYALLEIPKFAYSEALPGELLITKNINYTGNAGDKLMAENIQNYILNFETVLRNLSSYNFSSNKTVSERIFWKWLFSHIQTKKLRYDSVVNRYYEDSSTSVVKGVGLISAGSQRTDDSGIYNETFVQIPSSFGQMKVFYKIDVDENYMPGSYMTTTPNWIENIPDDEIETDQYGNGVVKATGIAANVNADEYVVRTDRYGVYNIINRKSSDTQTESSNWDSIIIDFDINTYRNKYNNNTLTFDDLAIGKFAESEDLGDYTFNAILVYYSIYDPSKSKCLATNAYGIYIIDNAVSENNNSNETTKYYFPSLRKLKTSDSKDGTSYSFRLNIKPSSAYTGNITVQDNSTPAHEMSVDFTDVIRNLSNAVTVMKSNTKTLYEVVRENAEIKQMAINAMEEINNIKIGGGAYTASIENEMGSVACNSSGVTKTSFDKTLSVSLTQGDKDVEISELTATNVPGIQVTTNRFAKTVRVQVDDGTTLEEVNDIGITLKGGDSGEKSLHYVLNAIRSGDSGDSNYVAYLDNEMDSISCTSNGNPKGTEQVKTTLSFWRGSEKIAISSIRIFNDSSQGYEYRNGEEFYNITVYWNAASGEIRVVFKPTAFIEGKKTFCIVATINDGGTAITRELYFIVNGIRDGLKGDPGASPYFADLDNEIDSVSCNSEWHPFQPENIVTTVASAWKGSNDLPISSVEISDTSTGGTVYPNGTNVNGIIVSWTITSNNANISCNILSSATVIEKQIFCIKITCNDNGTSVVRYLYFTVNAIQSTVTYNIAPSMSSIKRLSDGTYYPSNSEPMRCRIKKNDGGTVSYFEPTGSFDGMTLYYTRDDISSFATYNYLYPPLISAASREFRFEIRTDLSGTVVDKENVPVIYDGLDGSKGEPGTSPYFADLDNEMESLACDHNGKNMSYKSFSTNISFWKGSEAITGYTINVYDTSTGGQPYTNGETIRGLRVAWLPTRVLIGATRNIVIEGSRVLCIKVSKTISGVLIEQYLYFTINEVRSSCIFSLVPSTSSIKKSGLTYYPPESTPVTCDVVKNDGGIQSFASSSEYTLKYSLNGGAETEFNPSSPPLVSQVTSNIVYLLYDKSSTPILMDKETIPIVYDGEQGEQGMPGTSPYIADLDNEMDSLLCDNNGKPIGDVLISTKASLWEGNRQINDFIIEIFDTSLGGYQYPNGSLSADGLRAFWYDDNRTISGIEKGSIRIRFGSYTFTKTKQIFCIRITSTETGTSVSRLLYLTVNCVKNSCVYGLIPTTSSIKRSTDGTYYPSAFTPITCEVYKNNGDETITPDPSEYTLKYSLNGGPEVIFNSSVPPLARDVSTNIVFSLYDKSETPILLDTETIPILFDGSKGEPGTSVSIVSITYQKTSSNSSTPPTGTWSTTIPTATDGWYLWTRVEYSDGNISYSVSKWGTNGGSALSITFIKYQKTSVNSSTPPTGEWSTTMPTVTPGWYLWTWTKYSDGTDEYSVELWGGSGEDAYTVIVSRYATIFTQSTVPDAGGNYPLNLTNNTTTVKVVKGTQDKTSEATISILSQQNCTAVKEGGNTIKITSVNKQADGSTYYDNGYVSFRVTIATVQYDFMFSFACNLLGTWKEDIIGDVRTIVAESTTYTVDGVNYTVHDNLGTYIQSSNRSYAELKTEIDGSNGLSERVSYVEQTSSQISLKVGTSDSANILRDPIFATNLPFNQPTSGSGVTAAVTRVTSSGGTTDYHSPWEGDGGQLIKLDISANTSSSNVTKNCPANITNMPRLLLTAGKKYTFSVWIAGINLTDNLVSPYLIATVIMYETASGNTHAAEIPLYANNDTQRGVAGSYTQYAVTFTVSSPYIWFSWEPKIVIKAGKKNFYITYAGAKLEMGEIATRLDGAKSSRLITDGSLGLLSDDIDGLSGNIDEIDANLGEIRQGLLDTGIDIYSNKIVNTADTWECQNTSGQKTAWLDAYGNFTITGVHNNLITIIDWDNPDPHQQHRELIITRYIPRVSDPSLQEKYQLDPGDDPEDYDKEYHIDILRCGDFIYIKSLPDLSGGLGTEVNYRLPYYVCPKAYERGHTRFNTGEPHPMTADEMRQLIGRRIIIKIGDMTDHYNIYYNKITGPVLIELNHLCLNDVNYISQGKYYYDDPRDNEGFATRNILFYTIPLLPQVVELECRHVTWVKPDQPASEGFVTQGYGYVWVGQNGLDSSVGQDDSIDTDWT